MEKFVTGVCLVGAVTLLILAPFYRIYRYLRYRYLLWKRRSDDEKMLEKRYSSTGWSPYDDMVIDGEKEYTRKRGNPVRIDSRAPWLKHGAWID